MASNRTRQTDTTPSPPRVCENHCTTAAIWQCQACHRQFCPQCVEVRIFGNNVQVELCKACGGRCISIDDLIRAAAKPKSFFDMLLGALNYPLKGQGKFLLIAYGIFSLVLAVLAYVPFAGPVITAIVGIFMTAYIAAYMMKIIASSAGGDEELPDWPDFDNPWDDILRPVVMMAVAVLACLIPAIVYSVSSFSETSVEHSGYDPIEWGLFIVGLLCAPMALLAVNIHDSLLALNPLLVLVSIIKVWRNYLLACAALLVVIVAPRLIPPLPIVGQALGAFLSLYFMTIVMRIIGLIYQANVKRLGWFDS